MDTHVRARVIVSGRVQGVFFRMETQQAATRMGVFGWVQNRFDGTVEAVFEGEKLRVDRIIDWCRKGPPAARVGNVTVSWESYSGEFEDFRVTY